MKIKKLLSQNRRDFQAIYVCESCGYEEERYGYDDRNFHDNVIPNIKCKQCEKSRNDLGIVGELTQTRYHEGMQV